MGETDEFAPQSLHAEDEMVQEPAAEESAAPLSDAPAETLSEEPTELPIDEPTEPAIESLSEEPVESTGAQPVDEPAELSSEDSVVAEIAQSEIAVEDAAVAVSEPDAESDAEPDAESDELDEISQSLSDDAVADTAAEEGSFDDIAPVAPADAAVSHVPEPSGASGQVPWWPFLAYLGAWVVLAVAAVWQLLQLPADQVVYESTAYVLTILGGLIMTAVGPVLILAVWLGTRSNRSASEREGLLTSALMKGALVTLCGAIIWWASLVIIDYLRLGRLL